MLVTRFTSAHPSVVQSTPSSVANLVESLIGDAKWRWERVCMLMMSLCAFVADEALHMLQRRLCVRTRPHLNSFRCLEPYSRGTLSRLPSWTVTALTGSEDL